jgi:hypothetical protein
MIDLNIEYRKTRATVLVWRLGYNVLEDGQGELIWKQTVVDEVNKFRAVPHMYASLTPRHRNSAPPLRTPLPPIRPLCSPPLSDFASEALLEDLEDLNAITLDIIIPFSRLSEFLTRAETVAEKVKASKGKVTPLKLGYWKRWRQRTPEEELEEQDEKRFLESGERAARKVAQGDRDYIGRGL